VIVKPPIKDTLKEDKPPNKGKYNKVASEREPPLYNGQSL
jgi:hypothetical protein